MYVIYYAAITNVQECRLDILVVDCSRVWVRVRSHVTPYQRLDINGNKYCTYKTFSIIGKNLEFFYFLLIDTILTISGIVCRE